MKIKSLEQSGIRPIVIDEIRGLAKQHGLQKVILFGSRARGDFQERSDIDLAVTGGFIAGFSLDVQEDTSTLLFFDVVDLDSPISGELLESIKQDGVIVYEKI